MKKHSNRVLLATLAAGAALCCVLGFYGTSGAQVPQAPFANAVDLQAEVINQLKELNAQIKEQNALLRSGQLQVQVMVVEKAPAERSPAGKRPR